MRLYYFKTFFKNLSTSLEDLINQKQFNIMIKAVLFDIDGVLLDSKDANLKFLQDLMKESGYKISSKKEIQKVFHLTMWDAIKFLTKEKSERKIRKIWKLGCKLRYPMEKLKLPKHLKEVIKRLSRKYKLGIVTSRIRKGVQQFFQVSGTEKYFDVVVSFEDYSRPKPHPEPLLVATKKLKVKPEETVYIGDSETDVKAAKAAGMRVIIYSKKCFKDADLNVNSFEKIPFAIKKIEEIKN